VAARQIVGGCGGPGQGAGWGGRRGAG